MTRSLVITVTGLACTGKTTLGRRIAADLQIPFVSRDDFKELLFDSLGWRDREWSKKLGGASWRLLYRCFELLLLTGQPFIIESNFNPEFDNKRLLDAMAKHGYETLQIHCHAEGATLFERFKRRSTSAERHPGHVDHVNLEEFRPILVQGYGCLLDIGGRTIDVDTTDFEKVDYESLIDAARRALGGLDGTRSR